jgi:hypothetical protein
MAARLAIFSELDLQYVSIVHLPERRIKERSVLQRLKHNG